MAGCTAAVDNNDKMTLVVAGGEDSKGGKLKSVEIFSIGSKSWTLLKTELKFPRSHFPSVGIVNSQLLVTLGTDENIEILDENEFKIWGESKQKRFSHSTLKLTHNWCEK